MAIESIFEMIYYILSNVSAMFWQIWIYGNIFNFKLFTIWLLPKSQLETWWQWYS